MTAQPQMMRLSKADVETPVPAEVHLVPMEVHLAATETPAPVEAHLRPEEVQQRHCWCLLEHGMRIQHVEARP
jgi:hypothetical protein